MEGFFKKIGKKLDNVDDFYKVTAVAGAAAAAVGVGAAAETGAFKPDPAMNAQMPNFDTMPVDHVDPTAGKTPQSSPDPIVIPQAEVKPIMKVGPDGKPTENVDWVKTEQLLKDAGQLPKDLDAPESHINHVP